jgi:hypothetical protein
MKNRILCAALLSAASLVSPPAFAALIDVSDVELVATTVAINELVPADIDIDVQSGPFGSLAKAEALSRAPGIPFPNLPNSVGQAFASSVGGANGDFGVGVNGFFFRNSLPPNTLEASGAFTQTITNNAGVAVGMDVDFFVPAPTIQFFGVGNSFPAGADPARDATADVGVTMKTRVTHRDGSVTETIVLEYGMTVVREPLTGVLFPFVSRDAAGLAARFDEPDGSFGFQLPDLERTDLSLGEIGPGDTLVFSYEYFASASTGFGETGIFAAIGDPFDLSVGGAHIDLQVNAPVPEPATAALWAFGLLVLWFGRRWRSAPRKGPA